MRANLESRPPIERVREILRYEEATGRLIWRVTSGRAIAGNEAGGYSADIGYRRVRFLGAIFMAHHVIFAIIHGRWPQQLDHIDGDRLNNRVENLRECSQGENIANVGCLSTNTSGFKGVSFHKETRKWQAQIKARGKSYYLGVFETPELAHIAYMDAALEHFGEFARTENFKKPIPQVFITKREKGRPTQDELREVFDYNDETGVLRWKKSLSFRGAVGSVAGRLTADGYRRIGIYGGYYYAHILAWVWMTGVWPTMIIDHRDSNRSNNAWRNLQEITQSENVRKAQRPSPYPQGLLSTH